MPNAGRPVPGEWGLKKESSDAGYSGWCKVLVKDTTFYTVFENLGIDHTLVNQIPRTPSGYDRVSVLPPLLLTTGFQLMENLTSNMKSPFSLESSTLE